MKLILCESWFPMNSRLQGSGISSGSGNACLFRLFAMRSSFRFVPPCLPIQRHCPPSGDKWVHEIKFDGWRCQAHKQGDCVRLFSKKGNDLSHRFPSLARSLRGFAVDTVILDGEVVAVDEKGRPNFAALFAAEPELVQFWAFDLTGSGRASSRDVSAARTTPRADACV